uniref:CcmT n=1 Tax=Primula vulgaris TaxID=175104 RepID=A0A1L2F379_9ERIC|nr:CcmT [Primula vulgaris]
MGKTVFPKLTFLMIFVAITLTVQSQFIRPPPRPPTPQCRSQFALVNHACATIPYTPIAPPLSPPAPPLSPDTISPTSPGNDTQIQEHRLRHRHRTHITSAQETCCRWLKAVDPECVCGLLLRLPTFLARPAHSYTVAVGDACVFTYPCASRLRAD